MTGDQLSQIDQKEKDLLNVILLKMIKDALPEKMSTDGSLEFIANEIKSKYFYFRLKEVAMVLRKGALGMYGNIPGGGNPVLYWMHQYDIGERLDHFESEALKQKENYEKQFLDEERKELKELRDLSKKEFERLQARKEAQRKLDK